MPRLVKGNELLPETRAQVLNAYIYRWTRENPDRARVWGPCHSCDIREPYVNEKSAEGHSHPTIPLQTDEEWLAAHAFYVNKDGSLTKGRRGAEPAYFADHQ